MQRGQVLDRSDEFGAEDIRVNRAIPGSIGIAG
jgi:hypothetical protein